MPFTRPTLSDLITRIGGDLRGRLELGGALLRRATADALAAVWAGDVHSLYGYLDWLARQLFTDLADPDQLLRKAALYGITPTPRRSQPATSRHPARTAARSRRARSSGSTQ